MWFLNNHSKKEQEKHQSKKTDVMSSGVGLYRLKIMKKLFERIIARLRNYNLLFTIVKIIMLSERMFFIFFVNYSSWLYSQPAGRRYSRRDGQPDIVILPNANPFLKLFYSVWIIRNSFYICNVLPGEMGSLSEKRFLLFLCSKIASFNSTRIISNERSVPVYVLNMQ